MAIRETKKCKFCMRASDPFGEGERVILGFSFSFSKTPATR